MKILFTGGHHNSALAVAEALVAQGQDISWVGHIHTMIGDPHESLEFQEVTAANIPFHNLSAGKFHSRAHPLHLLRLPWGFIAAFLLLVKLKPQLIVSFGGYLSVPVSLVGKILGAKVIVMEQTTVAGRANKLVAHIADKIFLAWDSSRKYFPAAKTEVVGLPLRPELWQPTRAKIFALPRPTLLITGGKQGSQSINAVVFPIIPQLLEDFNVIHQTGGSLRTQDHTKAQTCKAALPPKFRPLYITKPHFTSREMLDALKTAQIVITRAGAHITYELLALGKPAILIPLPFSYNQEQNHNAQVLVDQGLGKIVPQSQLSSQLLLSTVLDMHSHIDKYRQAGKNSVRLVKPEALNRILDYILSYAPSK